MRQPFAPSSEAQPDLPTGRTYPVQGSSLKGPESLLTSVLPALRDGTTPAEGPQPADEDVALLTQPRARAVTGENGGADAFVDRLRGRTEATVRPRL